jgi:outer membrane protein assembly factor BamB
VTRRALGGLAISLALLVPQTGSGELAEPGETLVLHRGLDPAIPAAMPGGASHDGRLAYPLPASAPERTELVGGANPRPRGPVIDEAGRIYAGTGAGLAILAADGTMIAEVAVGVLEASPVLVPGGDVIAISRNGMIARVAPDGTVRARHATDLGVRFAPLVLEDGSFVVVGANRTVSRFGSDLEERFRTELPDGFGLSATLTSAGRIAVATGSELVIVDLDGSIVRSIALPGRAVTPPARAANGSLWVATTDGALVEVVHESRIRRTVALAGRVSDGTTLALAPSGDVLVAVATRGLIAIAPDGTERWVTALDAPFFGFVAVDASGRIAALDRLGRLSVVSPDGVVEWSVGIGGVPLAAPIVTQRGEVVLATDRGVVIFR